MKKAEIIVADIGSTITKICAFGNLGTSSPRFLGQGTGLTTVKERDVSIGFDRARQDLEARLNINTSDAKLMVASSAVGGLRMSVHGLTRDMTLKAAKEASLGAGAIVVFTSASFIQEDELKEIGRIKPNIILLSGGVDYGDRTVVVANAKAIAAQKIDAPVIYAGNRSARLEVVNILKRAGVPVIAVENVYPRIDELNIEPVRQVVQEVFSKHIITAPRMEKIRDMVTGDIIPTPGAVLASAKLLYKKLGDLVVVDIGGATSDVHSVTEGSLKMAKLMVAPEPKAKRTVEGDLGVYINASNIVEASLGAIHGYQEAKPVPNDTDAKEHSIVLAKWAVDISMRRHAGEIKIAYGAYGKDELVEGKDLTAVKYIIGTGGALVRLGNGGDILNSIHHAPRGQKLLPPPEATTLIDSHYIMATAGVLSQNFKEEAIRLLLDSLQPV